MSEAAEKTRPMFGNMNIFNVDRRVYIAGVLMPTLAVSITSTYNTPPTATIPWSIP
ncbi:MAG: hypothetical protein FWG17_06775 [Desulfovibrionaceae bacterium]|nr:hypothetical protein [Desulfovibrionaceae bacterium]